MGGFSFFYYSCSLGNPISLSSGEWPNAQSVLLFFSICSCITFLACPRKEAKLMSSCHHVIMTSYMCVPCTCEASHVMKRLGLKNPREYTVGQLVQKR